MKNTTTHKDSFAHTVILLATAALLAMLALPLIAALTAPAPTWQQIEYNANLFDLPEVESIESDLFNE